MPQAVLPGDEPKSSGKRTTLSVPVYIFKGKVKPFKEPTDDHPSLVKKVQADKNGMFRVPLAPGEYTVVAEIDGQMYLNLITAKGKDIYWATVDVKKDKWRLYKIVDSSGAAF